MTVQVAGIPMMPRTNEATQKPLEAPAASMVVPSIVNGMPQALQLLEVIALWPPQRGQRMICLPSGVRRIAGARSPAAA